MSGIIINLIRYQYIAKIKINRCIEVALTLPCSEFEHPPVNDHKRELKEETGYRAENWKKLITFFPSPGFLTEQMTIYLATGLTAGQASPMDDERIETRWFSAKQIEDAIDSEEIVDAKSMLGYFFWKRSLRKG